MSHTSCSDCPTLEQAFDDRPEVHERPPCPAKRLLLGDVWITGAAGTGKFTLLKELTKKLKGDIPTMAVAAPTGYTAFYFAQTEHAVDHTQDPDIP